MVWVNQLMIDCSAPQNNMNTKLFENRRLIIATKHEKEKVIAPLLEQYLGVICFTDHQFDTDTLGTFSGEIEREFDPITSARKKCLLAMEASNCDLGVASEGSFGAHPSVFFASADDEFLLFIDKKNNLEIIVRELSMETNFSGKEVETEKDLLKFANTVKFPSHGLILRKSKLDTEHIIKGITSQTDLIQAFDLLKEKFATVYAETDMRAMYNPSRMLVIQNACKKLVSKINSSCPQCEMPGYGITGAKKGLKCSLCDTPGKSALSHTYACAHCEYEQEVMYPDKKTEEDPMYCNYCNP
jgi:hypothetical protein